MTNNGSDRPAALNLTTRKCLVILLVLTTAPCLADVRLPRIFGSNMVLQRETEVNVWGWADPGEEVRINGDWLKEGAIATADAAGTWRVRIRTGQAGGPHTMTIAGKNRIDLRNILFGEVWLASGQSNMEMPLVRTGKAYGGVKNAAQEVATANYPDIRLYHVSNFFSPKPVEDVRPALAKHNFSAAPCQWHACSPETVPTFSATAYFFARSLHRELKVPIGIIDASVGATVAECWTPAEGLKKLGIPIRGRAAKLYNGMIHPLRNLTVKGVIWYQGEGNAIRANEYHQLFSTMIGEWRKAFGYEFPFYFVQLARYKESKANTALLREAQLETLSVPKTGMAVAMDNAKLDSHPNNKQDVGRRLALWALAKDYGREIVYSGPIYRQSVFEDGKARLKFDHVGSGLATRDGKAPGSFEIAGADKVFHPATAVIDGDEVIVSSDKVAEPQAVRYAFKSEAMPGLINKEGLPASPFRTDRW